MAFMLLTRRLACSLQHSFRLLVPGKPWGLTKPGPNGATNQTRDSWVEESWGQKDLPASNSGAAPPPLIKLSSWLPPSHLPCPPLSPVCRWTVLQVVGGEGATLSAQRW
jgi:hypothetical protein